MEIVKLKKSPSGYTYPENALQTAKEKALDVVAGLVDYDVNGFANAEWAIIRGGILSIPTRFGPSWQWHFDESAIEAEKSEVRQYLA